MKNSQEDHTQPTHKLSAEGRARIAEAQKARWAAKRAGEPAPTPAKAKKGRVTGFPHTVDLDTLTVDTTSAGTPDGNPADLIRSAIHAMRGQQGLLAMRIGALEKVLEQM
jgi:hypothetical protein